ncbi:hexokinase-2 [Dothidotthia symphoricarpi CBS 119687]|uniref:Phosphotransferase n=1 Tax=Dothidotthia symphoricarpi CBS 119687 TaxID=1392245 RepID=A0A6A6AEE6_9PLEO|nr:hexokinase-2 [Dothidotthia symphoricarpi CBS 119687]KAF2129368.1 hexokinase-2 [Dothidotthia symphoricarpi CBS 119687]
MAGPRTPEQRDATNDALQALTGFINTSSLLDLANRFAETYTDLAKTSTDHFLVTPVTALPTGKEKGKFLSIDVGGTNLRVGFVELVGELDEPATSVHESDMNGRDVFAKIKRSHEKNWPIGDHLKMDHAEDLFAWIGDCIAEVVEDALEDAPVTEGMESALGEELLLGITFSFPMAQTRLSEATLLPMGKGFAITSDLNLGKMLLAAYARHCVDPTTNGESKKSKRSRLPRIRVAAITNDTVATFASLAYAVKAAPNSRVAMGLIVGTGTNATVPMKLNDLHPAKRKYLSNPDAVDTVVINTEWTIRGTDKPLIDLNIKTSWDLTLDANSEAPGFQPFEYLTAGRYLGEIVRLVFVDIASRQPGGDVPPLLLSKNAILTRFLSEVVARADDVTLTKALETQYPAINPSTPFWTSTRVKSIRDIAHAVQQRSSALIAAACVGLLKCVRDIEIDHTPKPGTNGKNTSAGAEHDKEELVIAYAGGTISQYPQWLETCQTWIDILVKEGSKANASKRVVLKEALNGGIIGAGVLAGMGID